MTFLTAGQVQTFHQKGYLVLDEFYNVSELSDFTEALRKVVRANLKRAESRCPGASSEIPVGKEFNEGVILLENIDHAYIADIYDSIAYMPELIRLTVKKATSDCVNQLLGKSQGSPLYTFTCRVRINHPHDRLFTYGWHQEVFYSVPESRFLQTWAPLVQDATNEMGTMKVREGSHCRGILKQKYDLSLPQPYTLDDAELVDYPEKSMEIKLGQYIIFDSRLAHCSGYNSSEKVRFSLVGMYHDLEKMEFRPPKVSFDYKTKSPKEYYDEVFGRPPTNGGSLTSGSKG